ncbi:MAG: protein kinase [Planctomycetes bacterium]|nr:protein kinase [Planctomycetota bacterium]
MDVVRNPTPDRPPNDSAAPSPPAQPARTPLPPLDDDDRAFARVVLDLGLLSPEELAKALSARPAPVPGRPHFPLGPFLLRLRLLSALQLAQVQQEVARRSARCGACGAEMSVAALEPGDRLECPACAAPVTVPLFLAASGASGSLSDPAALSGAVGGAPSPASSGAPSAPGLPTSTPLPTASVTIAAPLSPDAFPPRPASRGGAGGRLSDSDVALFRRAGGATSLFGRYEILDVIGKGGMGVVYKARQLDLRRLVALKIMREGPNADEKAVQRFQREAEAAGRLRHPNLVSVYDAGAQDGISFLTMELVQGRTLEDLLKESSPGERQSLLWLETVARAVHYAHTQMVVHRDLKPANLLLDNSGQLRILDFGLAKTLDSANAMTQSGEILGTPYYMAPEQVQGRTREIGPQTDVWALGAILYQLLTGSVPFPGTTSPAVYHAILGFEPRKPRRIRPEITEDAQTICLKALEKDPARRYPTAQEMADDVARFLRGDRILARPLSTLGRSVRFLQKHPRASGTLAALCLLASAAGGTLLFRLHRLERSREARIRCDKARLVRGGAAEAFLSQALAIDPELADALYLRGYQYLRQARWGLATVDVRKAERIEPRPAMAHLALGLLADWGLGNPEEADLRFERAAEAEPFSATGLAAAGLRELLQDKSDPALEAFEKALAADPQAALAHYGRGRAHLARGDARAALPHFEKAAAIEPDHGVFVLGVAEAHLALCRYREARAEAIRALDLAPSLARAVLVQAQADACDEGGAPQALEGLGRYLELSPLLLDELRPVLEAEGTASLLRADRGVPEALTLRGMLRLDADPVAARADFEEALRLAPGAGRAQVGLGRALLASGKLEEATQVFTLAIEAGGGGADASEALACRAFARTRAAGNALTDAARDDYTASAKACLDPARSVAFPFYAAGVAELDRLLRSGASIFDNPDVLIRTSLPLRRALFENSRFAHAKVRLAELLLHAVQPQAALDRLEEAMHLNPFLSELYLLQGVILRDFREVRNLERARKCLDNAVGLDPAGTDPLLERAVLRVRAREWPRARADLDRLLQRSPDMAAAYKLRSECRLHVGDEPGAVADLRSWRQGRRDPARARPYYRLAQRLFEQRQFEESTWELSRAIEFDPLFGEAYWDRGDRQVRSGQYAGGFLDFFRSIELQPERDAQIFNSTYGSRGMLSLLLLRFEPEFIQNFRRNPHDASAAMVLGYLYVLLDRNKDARLALDKTLELNPEFACALTLRALVRLRTGDPDGATQDLAASRARAGSTGLLPLVEACLHASRGEKDAAFVALSTAVEVGKFSEEVLAQMKEFKALRDDPRWVRLAGDR